MANLTFNGQRIQFPGGGILDYNYVPQVFDDWFLPSSDTLMQMYTNLHLENVGDFSDAIYWSSYDSFITMAYSINFSNGTLSQQTKSSSTNHTRAVRSFTDSVGVYSLRDTGPAGGLIFYIDAGTTYYEAAPSDQSSSQIWSDNETVNVSGDSTDIGTGLANSLLIVSQSSTNSAAQICLDLSIT